MDIKTDDRDPHDVTWLLARLILEQAIENVGNHDNVDKKEE